MDAREARDEVASVERVTRLCGRLERGLARGDGGYGALDACFRRGAFADGVYASEKGFAGVSEKGAMGRGVSAESEDAVADAVELGHGAGEVLVVFRADALHLLGALDGVERGGGVWALAKGEAREGGGVVVIGRADRGVEGGARLHQERATKGGVGGVLVVARVGLGERRRVAEVDRGGVARPRRRTLGRQLGDIRATRGGLLDGAPNRGVEPVAEDGRRGAPLRTSASNDRRARLRIHRRARDDRG